MRIQTLLISFTVLLASCVSTKKYTSYVEPKIEDLKTVTGDTSGVFTFDFSGLESKNAPVVSGKIESLFIPAILYWQWNTTIKCEIDPKLVGNLFKQSFIKYADSSGLSTKLNGQNIEIKIEKIPDSFIYTHKGNVVFLVLVVMWKDLKAIYPEAQTLVISYKLTDKGQVTKHGQLVAVNQEQPVKYQNKTTEHATQLYIDQFKKNTNRLTKDIVRQLFDQL